jgi:hypothetical protein
VFEWRSSRSHLEDVAGDHLEDDLVDVVGDHHGDYFEG